VQSPESHELKFKVKLSQCRALFTEDLLYTVSWLITSLTLASLRSFASILTIISSYETDKVKTSFNAVKLFLFVDHNGSYSDGCWMRAEKVNEVFIKISFGVVQNCIV
jgi:hypothetical protein